MVVCTNLRLALELHSWGKIEHLGMWGSIILIETSLLTFSYASYSDAWPTTYDWCHLPLTAYCLPLTAYR